jgi:hypothetical protein
MEMPMKKILTLCVAANIAIVSCVNSENNKNKAMELAPSPPFAKKNNTECVAKVVPEMNENGIFLGSKGLRFSPDGKVELLAEGKELGCMFFNINTPAKSWMTQNGKNFIDKKWNYDKESKKYTFNAEFPLDKKGDKGSYIHSAKLRDDGLIEFAVDISVPESFRKKISQEIFFITIPFLYCEGNMCIIDGKACKFAAANDPKTKKPKSLFSGRASSFSFSPGCISTCFELTDIAAKGINLRENRLESGASGAKVGLRIFPKDGKVKFLLDLRKSASDSVGNSSDCHEGVDFWKSDRLHVPDYSKCKNLVQNPSFEGGLRYYAFSSLGMYEKTKYDNLYECDPDVAKFGNHSLKIHAIKGMRWPCSLGTFAFPVKRGQKYTVSCYTKGDRDKGLVLKLHSVSGKWPVFPKLGDCKIGKEWKRYEFSFVAPNNVISIFMGGEYKGDDASGEGSIWVDGLQMEKGDLTPFAEKPICSQLLTSNPDNFLEYGKNIDAVLDLYTVKPGNAGKVFVEVEDYHCRKLYQGEFNFKSDSKGVANIKLPFNDKFPRGVFVVKASFHLDDGFKETDYYRFSIMDFLTNTHKNKNITASGMPYFRIPRSEALLGRCRAVGLGAAGYSTISSEHIKKLEEYGISQDVGSIDTYRNAQSGGFHIRGNKEKKYLFMPIPKIEKVTPEFLGKIEKASYEKAKMYPDVKYWLFDGEPNQRHKYEGLSWDDIVKIHEASCRGVKRANPNNKFINGGPTNMMPRGGTEWVRKFLMAGGNKFCDGSEIHPYRTVPEDPDLDSDAQIYFKMLDECGMKGRPAFWLEGIYHTNYVLPAYGLDSHKACSTDHYRCGAFSYHMGWGERIAAAYFARSWLVGLKYAKRLKSYDGWAMKSMYLDSNFTPYALQKVVNTIGRLLGNADFKYDVRFAPETRCYIFEDEEKRPVAALWSHRAKVDRGYDKFPFALVPVSGDSVEVFDLMEVPLELKQKGNNMELPLPFSPVFVRGKAGSLESFKKAFENSRLENEKNNPLKVTVRPAGAEKLELKITNLLSRDFDGGLSLDGKSYKLNLKPLENKIIIIDAREQIPFNNVAELKLPLKIKANDGSAYSIDASFRGFAIENSGKRKIVIDGNLEDWKGVPEIKMKNRLKAETRFENKEKFAYPGDFDASFKMLWDHENIYLAVELVDDKYVRKPDLRGKYDWANDTMQIFIDTFCDARSKVTRGFDTNDYNYDFFPDPKNGNAVAYRRFAPEQQITGGTNPLLPKVVEPGIKTSFKLTDKGYIYEVAFPKKYIVPVKLNAGEIVGFCIYLNDRDNEEIKKRGVMKSALTLTPPGTGGHMNPHLYPVMLLSGKTSQ